MFEDVLYHYKVLVTRVIDGDTFCGEIDLGFNIKLTETFRLAGIDTPETWRPRTEAERAHGLEATKFVRDLIEGQIVICKSVADGKYGRCIVKVFVTEADFADDESLSDILIEHDFVKRDDYL